MTGPTRADAGMATYWRRVGAVARLDAADVFRSRWAAMCALLYVLLAAAFVGVGLRESTVLGFTGMPRVLLASSQVLVLVVPLLALGSTALVVNRARRDGSLEMLFSHPVSRGEYFTAVTIVRTGAIVLPLLVLMPAVALGGWLALGEAVPWALLWRALAVSAALAWSFVALGLLISVSVDEPARAMAYLLAAWLGGVALLDFGVIGAMLQWHWPPALVFAVAGANPVEMARVALVANAEPTLGTLGPVGWFLLQRIGAAPLLAAGVLWPLTAGTLVWLVARRRLTRGDLV